MPRCANTWAASHGVFWRADDARCASVEIDQTLRKGIEEALGEIASGTLDRRSLPRCLHAFGDDLYSQCMRSGHNTRQHLFGAVGGVVAAYWVAKADRLPS